MAMDTITANTTASSRPRRRGLLGGLVAAACLAVGALGATPASAAIAIESFDGLVLAEDGTAASQAGSHPFEASTEIVFETDPATGIPAEAPKDIRVDLPAGFIGNPEVVPKCTNAELSANSCPSEGQVGLTSVDTNFIDFNDVPVFNMTPQGDEPARFGFNLLFFNVYIHARIRTGSDYGLSTDINNLSESVPLIGTSLTFFGTANDQPFLTNPTACSGEPLETTLRVNSYDNPDDFATASFLSHDASGNEGGVSGCDLLRFDPTIDVAPQTSAADSPSGLTVDLGIPQGDDGVESLATAHMKKAVVKLPPGVSINPAAGDGLGACSPAQIGLGNASHPSCPDNSKIGSVQIDTPLLADPMTGAIYLAEQGNNPFNSDFAIYVVAEEGGVLVKLPGELDANPVSGQLTATFDDTPQVPFSNFRLHFFGGPRAVLATPQICGTYGTTTELTPWSAPDSGPPATPSSSFNITSGPNGSACSNTLAQRPFAPGLQAGLVNPVAGQSGPFVFRLTRPDGHQEFDQLHAALPEGVSAQLAGVPVCSGAQQFTGNCPAGSRVGTAVIGAGAGPNPRPFLGQVFLAGPYKDAPLSLLIKVFLVAGPINLDTVIVRARVEVDPQTAALTVKSDPIPKIQGGVPFRIQDILIKIDREGFMLAPTDCEPTQVGALAIGSHGASVNPSPARFQVGGCRGLEFDPKLRFEVSGKGATNRSSHPELEVTLTPNEGDANLRRLKAALPRGVLLDQGNLANICTRPQYAAGECPENSVFGSAVADTPLLAEPVVGPVYLRASDNPLPDLVADLEGQDHPIEIDLVGEVDSKNNRIRNDFQVVPDVPVENFELTIDGGSDGLLVNSRNLCAQKKFRKTNNKVFGQNGKTAHQKRNVQANACKRKNAKRLERRAERMRRKARRAEGAAAKRMRRKADKLERRAERIEQRLAG